AGASLPTPNVNAIDPGLRTPYVQQFNFNVQHEIVKNTFVEAGWYGSKGTRLLHIRDVNSFLNGARPVPRAANGVGISRIDLRESDSNSTFHSLQTTLRRAYKGSNFSVSYTFSKAIDDISLDSRAVGGIGFQDPRNTRADKGRADFDARHRLVFSWI